MTMASRVRERREEVGESNKEEGGLRGAEGDKCCGNGPNGAHDKTGLVEEM